MALRMLLLSVSLLLVACGQEGMDMGDHRGGAMSSAVAPPHNREQVARGAAIYQRHCAVCHGAQGEGNPNWRVANPDGSRLPPPLNGSGHAWHHPEGWLVAKIREGSAPGQGNMPPWEGQLDAEAISAVIAWFKGLWRDDIFQAWQRMNRQSMEKGK